MPICGGVARVTRVGKRLHCAGLQPDKVVYAGWSVCTGLDAALWIHLREDAVALFVTVVVAGGGMVF
jgi:hypothetical protein